MQLTGIHHLTAVTADASANRAFYTQRLGMRLVKRTVNQDDPSAYHLFYADGRGSPGTDLTFFEWPVAPERRGTRSVVRTRLRVADVGYWADRLGSAVVDRDGRPTLDVEDPEGQRLALVQDAAAGHPWDRSTVPPEQQVRGLGPVTISVPELSPTHRVLTDAMGLRTERTYDHGGVPVHVYAMGDGGGPGAELHVAVEPAARPHVPGAGGVHHVAFRVPTFGEHAAWAERLRRHRLPNSGVIDRFYFRSLYFRAPAGILFELATDGPGFDADEPMASLGERLSLPPSLEPQRAAIEAGLKPL